MWSAWQGPGLGHLRLAVRESGVVADGLVLGVTDGRPFRLSYEVRCDPYWRVRAARVGVPGEPRVELLSDGEGNWTGSDGRTVSYLQGCEYVDISETPFTNNPPYPETRPRARGFRRDHGRLLRRGRAPTLAGAAALHPPADGRRGRELPVRESRRRV
jgi:hypothetical protein